MLNELRVDDRYYSTQDDAMIIIDRIDKDSVSYTLVRGNDERQFENTMQFLETKIEHGGYDLKWNGGLNKRVDEDLVRLLAYSKWALETDNDYTLRHCLKTIKNVVIKLEKKYETNN